MAYAVIEDFRLGVNRTRMQVAGKPGSLWECVNAHITRGGEIEKRKKFAPKYTLPAGTFGMQAAGSTLYVFGSGADPGVPTGVTYQRLESPIGASMTGVVASEVFDGAPYVIAAYDDGRKHHFNNGVRVTDWDGGTNLPSAVGTTLKTFSSKMYSTAASIAYASGLNDASAWDFGSGGDAGAWQQNMATKDAGSAALTAIGDYNGYGAFFSRDAILVWNLDTDPDNNALLFTMPNTGTRSPGSVVSYGNIDTFYLSGRGFRTIQARDSSGAPFENDIGVAIDDLVLAHLASLTDQQIEAAVGVIEPVDGRLLQAVGDVVYVFSGFPGAKISAWSTYEPGFQITQWAVVGTRLYARSGNTIYLYGGDDGDTYDADETDLYEVTVTLPFMSAGKPAHEKDFKGMDVAAEGVWEAYVLMDPRNTARRQHMGTFTGTTFPAEAHAGIGPTTHFAPHLICRTPGAAKLAQLAVHYTIRKDTDVETPK